MSTRQPFKRNVPAIAASPAFGGVGRVRDILQEEDMVSEALTSVTHAVVKPDSVAGWYDYQEDLAIIVVSGKGELLWRSGGGISIESGDFAYIPAQHHFRLDNPGQQEFEAIFFRVRP